MKKTVTHLVAATLLAAPALANDFSGKSGACNAMLCSSKKSSDFEKVVNRAAIQHPENGALKDLRAQLAQTKDAKQKNAVVVKFFALKSAMDETSLEKSIEQRLNDGQSDKLSNDDVRTFTNVFTGVGE